MRTFHLIKTIEVPASGKKSWSGGAYTLAFVRSKKGNFVLKGYLEEIREYLQKNHTHYFVNFTLFGKGNSRNIWSFWKNNVSIYKNTTRKGKREFRRGMYISYTDKSTGRRVKKVFKRLPNKWIPEFDEL